MKRIQKLVPRSVDFSFSSSMNFFTRRNLVSGNTKNGLMDPVKVTWTDIIGYETGNVCRLAAGELLAMLDYCAARTSGIVANRASKPGGPKYQVCTVGVTNTVFSSPILHGDAVRMESTLAFCGNSSMGIHIEFYRRSPSTRTETRAGESFFTMVTIHEDLSAAKVVPAIELKSDRDIAIHEQYCLIQSIQKKNYQEQMMDQYQSMDLESMQCPINAGKRAHVPIHSTRIEANRIFFSSYLNNNNTVFGGEIMRWMEKHAIHCGRMFVGNRNVFTVGMHSLAFAEPIFSTDWVTLEAFVVYVRNTTMEVDVTIKAERDNRIVLTNSASFVLINNDDIGEKIPIPVGIDIRNADASERKRFAIAKNRYQRSMQEKKALDEIRKKASRTQSDTPI